jgi:hypothetical protein
MNADEFRCFFSAGTGWGTFEQRRQGEGYTARIAVREAELTVSTLIWSAAVALPQASLQATHSIEVTLDDQRLPSPQVSGDRLEFAEPVALHAGQVLSVGLGQL